MQGLFAFNGRRVTCLKRVPIQYDFALGDMNPGMASRSQDMRQRVPGTQFCQPEIRILMDLQRPLAPGFARDQVQSVRSIRKGFFRITGSHPPGIRFDPDLQEMHRLVVRGIELAVHHPASGRHVLDVSRLQDAAVSHRILVLQGAIQNVCHNLHVPVGVHSKPPGRHHEIVVDHPQAVIAHPFRIVVIRKTESVPGIQPAVGGVAPLVGFPNFHHARLSHRRTHSGKDHVSCLGITKRHTPGMELRHLRYFVAVAETENVTRAAMKLHVSQPALSRQVRDLEEEIGFRLLERTAKSVKLTEAGRVFLAEARVVLQRTEEAVKTARAVATGNRGHLHIGYAPSPTARLLPPTLRAFQAASSGLRIKLHDMSTEEMLAGLREGKLHMAFLVRPTPAMLRGLHFEELLRDPVCLAVPPGHPFTRRRTVPLSLAVKEPFVVLDRGEYPEYHKFLAGVFARTKSQPRIAEEHESIASIVSSVEAGCGLALAPQTLACSFGSRVHLLPLSPQPEPLVIGAVWLKPTLSPAAVTLLDHARKAAAEISRA